MHPGDYFVMTGEPYVVRLVFGLRRPRHGIPGRDLTGVVAVGKDVTDLQPGDEVFGWSTAGTLAEYACVPADNRARARQPARRGGGSRAHVGHDGLAGTARHRTRATGPDGAGHRRLAAWAPSPSRSPRRSAPRRPVSAAPATSTWSGRSVPTTSRLHDDRLHPHREALRRRPRQRGSPAPGGCPPSADAHRHPHPQQRTQAAGSAPSVVKARAVRVHPSAAEAVHVGREAPGPAHPGRPARDRAGHVIDRTYPLDEAVDALRRRRPATPRKVVVTV